MNTGELEFIYWNTENKNSKEDILENLPNIKYIDVLLLGECILPLSTPFCIKHNFKELEFFSAEGERITQRLYYKDVKKIHFKHLSNFTDEELEEVFFKKTIDGELVHKILKRFSRMLFIETTFNEQKFLLTLVHLPSKKNLDEVSQLQAANNYKRVIAELASLYNNKVAIVGDFNMNPFDLGMVEPHGFFAINFKRKVQEETIFQHLKEKMYYNPCWGLLGDYDKIKNVSIVSGSHFYKGSPSKKLFWHLFDQIIVSKNMIPNFLEEHLEVVQIEKIIDEVQSNITRSNAVYSDHLPLKFTLKL